jgi:hypothetical protein
MAYSLQYVGPKQMCSASGVGFQSNKEDKYIYLGALCDLIASLDYDYNNNENHATQAGQNDFDEKTILSIIRSFVPDLDTKIQERITKTMCDIDASIVRAQHNTLLTNEAKDALINNIKIMESYQTQRAINKAVYYTGMEVLASIVKKRHIRYIKTSMEPKALHVLHSLQGTLRRLHPPIDSKMEIVERQEHLEAELQILN